jgi:hypothetical protein
MTETADGPTYTVRLYSVPWNSPRTTVRKVDGLWCVQPPAYGAWAKFGDWGRAIEYATTGRIEI